MAYQIGHWYKCYLDLLRVPFWGWVDMFLVHFSQKQICHTLQRGPQTFVGIHNSRFKGSWRFVPRFSENHWVEVTWPNSPQGGPEKAQNAVVKMKSKLQLSLEDNGDARNLGHSLRKAVYDEWNWLKIEIINLQGIRCSSVGILKPTETPTMSSESLQQA